MPTRALVLSGGGAKGAFQVGAEKYLREEKGYTWDIIAGVSVGSLNGGMLAMEKYAALWDLWWTVSNDKIFKGKLNLWAVIKTVFGARSALSNEPLKQLIEREFDAPLVTKDLRIGAVSLRTGKYEVFRPDHPEFKAAVLASTTMPVYWEPVDLALPHGDTVDGGLRNVSPLGDVLADDPDEVVIINCSPREPSFHEKSLKGVLQIAVRSLDIAVNEIFVNDVREFLRINANVQEAAKANVTLHHESGRPYKYFNALIIEPMVAMGDTLDFSHEAVVRRLEAGRLAAQQAIAAVEVPG